jgi:outer membrane assembly lipoprotein YfiO
MGVAAGARVRRRLPVVALALLAISCGHGGQVDIATLSSSSDQVIWEAGEKAAQKKQWENARQYFKRLVEGFPQSRFGPSARLALGDSYFTEGGTANYILAIAAYREFLTLYPSHPRSDYAQFQVGECHFKQRNPPDRDSTETQKALEEFERLLDYYPSSSRVEEARKRIVTCRQELARGSYLVGYFYERTRKAYRAAVSRYDEVIKEYPDYEGMDEVLYHLARCLSLQGRNAEALPKIAQLLEGYPKSKFADDAQKLREEIQKVPSAPVAPSLPATTPSPAPTPSSPGSPF